MPLPKQASTAAFNADWKHNCLTGEPETLCICPTRHICHVTCSAYYSCGRPQNELRCACVNALTECERLNKSSCRRQQHNPAGIERTPSAGQNIPSTVTPTGHLGRRTSEMLQLCQTSTHAWPKAMGVQVCSESRILHAQAASKEGPLARTYRHTATVQPSCLTVRH